MRPSQQGVRRRVVSSLGTDPQRRDELQPHLPHWPLRYGAPLLRLPSYSSRQPVEHHAAFASHALQAEAPPKSSRGPERLDHVNKVRQVLHRVPDQCHVQSHFRSRGEPFPALRDRDHHERMRRIRILSEHKGAFWIHRRFKYHRIRAGIQVRAPGAHWSARHAYQVTEERPKPPRNSAPAYSGSRNRANASRRNLRGKTWGTT